VSIPGAGEAAEPEPGSEFAGHRIEAVIGRGGMGVVYRARNLALDLDRALKVLAPRLSGDPRFRDRFRRESRLAASIEHPNVIPVHAAGEERGQLYIAMRLVEGRDLRDLISEEGLLNPGAAAGLVGQVAAALDAAHRAGLVHRDVKPANVLVGGGADAGRVYLTDFGISRTSQAGETVTATGELVGTADFIAPEQIAGDTVDRRADVYALGGVLHYALTGEPPFPRENELATLFAHANASRPRPSATRPGLPPALDEVVARAMAVRPEDRYESAGDLARALTAAAPRPDETTRGLAEPKPERRRHALWIATALGVAAAIVAVFLIVAGGGEEPDSDRGGVAAGERPAGRGGAGGGEPQPKPAKVATVKVGEGPIGVTVGEGTVWTAVRGADEVVAIDPGTERVASTAGVRTPTAVAVGFRSVWAVTSVDNSLYRLDPAGGQPQRFEIGLNPSDVAVDGRWVWVTLEGENRVARFDPDAETFETEPVGEGPRAVATGEGAVWVTNIEEGSVSKIDPDELRRVGSTIEVEGRPSDIAAGGGSVWTVDVLGGRLVEIAARAPGAQATRAHAFDGFNLPRGVKLGFGSVWVASGGDSTLSRIDPASGEITGTVRVGVDPADVAIGEGSVWTADEEGDSVTRVDPAQASP
jgi:DNA-binding beta-propeller fold protein YncE